MAIDVRDLGTLEGDILVFGGPYSNLEAIKALFARAEALGIPAANCICTGDVVGYCADPVATLDCVFDRKGPIVAGNVERQLASGAAGCGCGFEPGSECDLLSRGWYPFAKFAVLADTSWPQRLADLPDMVVFSSAGRRVAVIHGGVTDVARFLWPTSPDAEYEEELSSIRSAIGQVDAVISGHAGLAFHKVVDGVHWFNAGAIGLPANNGSPETRFVVMTQDEIRIESLAYAYDIAAEKMKAAGLIQGYHTALATGWWPSEDILPRELRRRR